MAIIYEPKGKAKEYSPLAANLYKGCSHGCVYCFAPKATFTDPKTFVNQVGVRKNALAQLAKEAPCYAGDPRQILLSFTSDPYQPVEEELKITRQAMKIMTQSKLNITVLTKGGLLAIRDFDLLAANPKNEFAVTLTTDNEDLSRQWEPGASLPADRIESLRQAKQAGIRTWVSFEPVFDPDAVYRLIDATHEIVDFYKVGKMNYHPHAKTIDWPLFRERTIAILERYGKKYLIKKDLLAAQ
jgi:DNA repair photolyase